MIDEITQDAADRMDKSINALGSAFNKIRTGRAHPSILDGVMVEYYGSPTPINQVANVNIEDARTLSIAPWEKNMVVEVEKAILKSDLGLNPATSGDLIRVPMPALTEETRKGYIKQAKQEAENARVSVRNIRRDANSDLKELLKEKEVSEDEERKAQDLVQKITDEHIAKVDKLLASKEAALMEI